MKVGRKPKKIGLESFARFAVFTFRETGRRRVQVESGRGFRKFFCNFNRNRLKWGDDEEGPMTIPEEFKFVVGSLGRLDALERKQPKPPHPIRNSGHLVSAYQAGYDQGLIDLFAASERSTEMAITEVKGTEKKSAKKKSTKSTKSAKKKSTKKGAGRPPKVLTKEEEVARATEESEAIVETCEKIFLGYRRHAAFMRKLQETMFKRIVKLGLRLEAETNRRTQKPAAYRDCKLTDLQKAVRAVESMDLFDGSTLPKDWKDDDLKALEKVRG
jgi:hypothetical protein